MVRVTRSVLLHVLALGSCVFLLFQLYYYRNYVIKNEPRPPSPDSQWVSVRSFLSAAHSCRLPVFLIDVSVLNSISHNTPGRGHCNFLCQQPITAFGLNLKHWSHDSCFLSALDQKDFLWTLTSGEDPRLVGLDVSGDRVPLHLLLRHHGNVIQVVFFVERGPGFLWHGALRLRPDQDRTFPFRQLQYGRQQGAYGRLDLVLTVLDGLDVRVPRNITHFLSEQKHAHFLECSYRDARNFLQTFPQDSGPSALDFRRKVQTLLQISSRTLDQIQVPFWISSGTCLGWVRQCGVISYSRDVDIGVRIQDYRPEILQVLTEAGLRLKHRFGKVEDSLELSFLLDDVKLDIFFFYDDKDVSWNGGTQARTGRKFKYVFPQFALCWTLFLDLKLRVPCPTLDYVRANYGEGWSIPTASWDWKTSPSNVLDNGAWPVEEWEAVIQVF